MKYVLLILFATNIYAQDYASEILLTSTAIIFGATSGYSEAYRLNEAYLTDISDAERLVLNRKWHDYATLRNISGLGLGIEIGMLEEKPIPIALEILSSAIVFWFVNDGVMNLKRGYSWFRQSDTRLNAFEQFNKPGIKIGALSVALLLKYIKINYFQ